MIQGWGVESYSYHIERFCDALVLVSISPTKCGGEMPMRFASGIPIPETFKKSRLSFNLCPRSIFYEIFELCHVQITPLSTG